MMTASEAKAATKKELDNMGVAFTKLTAKTLSFTDLARGSAVMVTIHGIDPDDLDDTSVIADELFSYVRRKGKGYMVNIGGTSW